MKKWFFLIIMFLVFSIGSISIGYSAFSANLKISGEAVVRYDYDVRISGIDLVSKSNDGTETYNSSFSKSFTSMSVNLLNTNSSVTYRVTITNNTDNYFTLKSIVEDVYTNKNVKYTISGIDVLNVYQGNTFSFNITFTTTVPNQICNLTLKYDLDVVSKNVWIFEYSGGEQTFKTPYNATYKLEVWGAQGGTITNTLVDTTYYGVYGGYSVGEVSLNANTNLYINVGGEGTSCLNYGTTTAGTRTCGDDGGFWRKTG